MEENKIIEFRGIVKQFDNQIVLKGINLDIYENEFVTLLGPSGCGKTTLLRILGGFLDADEGKVIFAGEEISKKPPYERELNTVFQKYALFPHLSVYENIAFGLKIKKVSKDVIDQKVMKMLRLIGLEGYEDKNTTLLSGGQQQRVAIARALVNEPKVLLLDEPLAALDLKLRKEMQYEQKRIQQEVGITFIFVTHDQEEALTMSDKIVVMSNGEIQQVGTPEEIYDEPKNAFVADFIGESNIFNGVMTGHKKVSFCQTEFDCVDDIKEGLRVQAVIRPEDVVLTEVGKGKLQGEVLSSIFKGTFHEITVLHNEKDEIVAQASGDIAKGTKVGVDILPDSIHLMHFNEKANHFIGMIDDAMRIRLVDGSVKVDMTKLFPGSTLQDGVLYDKSGHPIETEGRKVVVYINPRQAQLSDDPQVGLVQGHIDSLIYMGDHYSYEVRSSNDELYFVYDEYLWNIGDYVSVVVPDTGISVTLAE